jgi:predicted DsbA family dithiol-disulfide isomerase
VQERLTTLGAAAGIDYRFDRITRMPNTRAAHALAALAGDRQGAVVEGLFRAYFEQGRDVGDLAVLAAVASDAGLDGMALRPRLEAAEGYAAIAAEELEAQRLGITGVPFFVFAGRWAVSGAQETAALVAALDQVVAELAREPPAAAPGPR